MVYTGSTENYTSDSGASTATLYSAWMHCGISTVRHMPHIRNSARCCRTLCHPDLSSCCCRNDTRFHSCHDADLQRKLSLSSTLELSLRRRIRHDFTCTHSAVLNGRLDRWLFPRRGNLVRRALLVFRSASALTAGDCCFQLKPSTPTPPSAPLQHYRSCLSRPSHWTGDTRNIPLSMRRTYPFSYPVTALSPGNNAGRLLSVPSLLYTSLLRHCSELIHRT